MGREGCDFSFSGLKTAAARLADAEVEVAVDGRPRRWRGDIETRAATFVGRVDLGDAVDVEVTLRHPQTGRVANRYPLLLLEAGRR